MAWTPVANPDQAAVVGAIRTHEVAWAQAELSPLLSNGEALLEVQAEDEWPIEALDQAFVEAVESIPEDEP